MICRYTGLRLPIAVYDPFFDPSTGADGHPQQHLAASSLNVTVSVSSEVVPGTSASDRIQQGEEVVTLTESGVGSKMFTGSIATFRSVQARCVSLEKEMPLPRAQAWVETDTRMWLCAQGKQRRWCAHGTPRRRPRSLLRFTASWTGI